MRVRSRNADLPRVRTLFNARSFLLVAMSILLCAGIAGCGGGPGTVPGAFELSSPMNGATDPPLTPTLSWTDADEETSYTVEIDDENTFSPPLVHESTGIAEDTTSFAVPDGVLADGTLYYWRLIAVNSAGSTTASNAPFSFTPSSGGGSAPGAFALSLPMDGATDLSLTPTLSWTDADGETSYTVEIDDENTFSLPLVHQDPGIPAGSASYVVPGGVLEGETTYYWRIIAENSEGSTIASNAPFSFTPLSSGALVPGFGADGVVTGNPSTGPDLAYGIAIDSTAMYVVGEDYSPGNYQWRIEKRSLPDGSLVSEFGTSGVVTSNPSTGSDVANRIAIDSTAMYVVGHDASPGNDQWRIEKRSLADGSLVPEFGTGGVVTSSPSTIGNEEALGIAIDSTAMYVVGNNYIEDSDPADWQWRIEKRSLADGSLVSEFGTGGVITSNLSSGLEEAYDIAIDSTAMYVIGYDDSPGNDQWRIEKRSLADGSLVAEFGTGGVVTGNPSTSNDVAEAIALDSTAMYVVGYDASPGNDQWRIEKRSLADGSLVSEFGTSGVVTSNPSTGYDVAEGIAIDSTAMYVVGFDVSPGNGQCRIEKRSLADGSLVSEFGTGGVITVNPGTGSDLAQGIAIDSAAIYVVGSDCSPGNFQWRIEKRVK